MKNLWYKLKPESGISHALHFLLSAWLPIMLLGLVRLNFAILAAVLVLLAKWRMVAIKPRYWLPNIRANLVDIFIGLSAVAFIAGTNSIYTQALWTVLYIIWLVWLKPKSKPVAVMAQALAAQAIGLIAFYRAFPDNSLLFSLVVTWLVCYASARHFLGAFDEPMTRTIANIWAWFGAAMAWILGHWVIEYLFLPQIALVLTVLGYGLATIYYLDQKEKLKAVLFRQLIIVMGLLLLIIIVFSDWQDKTI
jgi:hypothetical protein